MLAFKFLDVLIGLAFIYTLVCLLVAGINELLAQWSGRRGRFLREGLLRLLPDNALYLRLIHHPAIAGVYRGPVGQDHPPSYLDSRTFALSLADIVMTRAASVQGTPASPQAKTFADLYAALVALKDRDLATARALLPILDRSQGDY